MAPKCWARDEICRSPSAAANIHEVVNWCSTAALDLRPLGCSSFVWEFVVDIRIKRIYDPPAPSDGIRILIDRLWPRGLRKEDAAIDVWAKDLAPSHELRRWFAHEVEKFEEFTRRYRLELDSSTAESDELMTSAGGSTVTLLYAAKNTRCNNAVVLQAWLQRHLKTMGRAPKLEHV